MAERPMDPTRECEWNDEQARKYRRRDTAAKAAPKVTMISMQIVDLVVVRRTVQIPTRCPKCGSDFTGHGTIQSDEYGLRSYGITLDPSDDERPFDYDGDGYSDHDGELGPVRLTCRGCDSVLAEGDTSTEDAKSSRCGHSICSQYFIDSGDTICCRIADCLVCEGNGWLHMDNSMGRGPGVERCDDCCLFDSDEEACEAHAKKCNCGLAAAICAPRSDDA